MVPRRALILSLTTQGRRARQGSVRTGETCADVAAVLRDSAAFECIDMQPSTGDGWQGGESPALLVLVACPETLPLLEQVSGAIRRMVPPVPSIAVLCGFDETSRLAACGCDDFVVAPVRPIDLSTRVLALVDRYNVRGSASARPFAAAFIGESPVFRSALELAGRFAAVDSPVLILGETGSGKELFARAVHYGSERKGKPFVPLNCGAVPEHLFENELFGHSKGAFTDASTSEKGLLGIADGGTLFLDEIDALSLSSQVKLLRFLENFEYRPLGAAVALTAEVRVLAATNADLEEATRQRRFREDLYFRLNVLRLHVPPLRTRSADVVLLARHFVAEYARRYRKPRLAASQGFFDRLSVHTWPGNVRELRSVVERAVVTAASEILGPGDADVPAGPNTPPARTGDDLATQKKRAASDLEMHYLSSVLSAHGGNVTRAAKAAGRDRRSFQRLMRKHGV